MVRNTILLAIIALVVACQPQKQKDTSQITIAGKLKNAGNQEVFIFKGRRKTKISVEDSVFTLKLPATGSGIIKTIGIADNKIELFLMPGDSVFVTYDTETKEYSFSGNKILSNNYLKAKAENNEAHFFDPWSKFSLDLDAFTVTMDSLLKSNNDFLDKFTTDNPAISNEFTYFEKADINYQVYLYKSYYSSNLRDTKDSIDQESAWFDFEKSINFNDAKLINSSNYQQFVSYSISNEAGELSEKDSSIQKMPNPMVVSRLEVIKNKITDKQVLNYHLFTLLKMQLDYYATKGIDNVLPYFKENCSNQQYLSEIDSLKTEWEKIGKGKASFNFSATDINGKEYKQENFKGKYVYIDCWATWCGPCCDEIPYLEKIIDENKDKNIAFVSLSFDNNKSDWENWMKTKETKGYQLYLEKEEKTKLAEFYKVRGIPRFILIGQEGKIYDVQAERPSGNIREVLDNLEYL